MDEINSALGPETPKRPGGEIKEDLIDWAPPPCAGSGGDPPPDADVGGCPNKLAYGLCRVIVGDLKFPRRLCGRS